MVCIVMMQTISFGNNINETVYVNSGWYTTMSGSQFPYKAINPSTTFDPENRRFVLAPGDSLFINVINNDSIAHAIEAYQTSSTTGSIAPGDSAMLVFSSTSMGDFILYDPTSNPDQKALGLASMITVTNASTNFYWNIKDHSAMFCDSISAGAAVDWNNYYPDYFTINSRSNPNINGDSEARIVGAVGDTLTIHIANTGQSAHSLHFHGYHCEIISSSAHPNHVGRSKDTFPIKPMETLTLELIPHQTGEYPVHDHNLLAITSGGLYPFGMFLTILIQ